MASTDYKLRRTAGEQIGPGLVAGCPKFKDQPIACVVHTFIWITALVLVILAATNVFKLPPVGTGLLIRGSAALFVTNWLWCCLGYRHKQVVPVPSGLQSVVTNLFPNKSSLTSVLNSVKCLMFTFVQTGTGTKVTPSSKIFSSIPDQLDQHIGEFMAVELKRIDSFQKVEVVFLSKTKNATFNRASFRIIPPLQIMPTRQKEEVRPGPNGDFAEELKYLGVQNSRQIDSKGNFI